MTVKKNTRAKQNNEATGDPIKADVHLMTDHIADRIGRIADTMTRIGSRTIRKRWGIRHTDLRLLNILDNEKSVSVRELSRRAHVDQAWVSRSLLELEQKRLVKKRNDPNDSRRSLISLTSHGRKMLDKVRPKALEGELLMLDSLNSKKLKAQLDILEKNVTAILDGLNG